MLLPEPMSRVVLVGARYQLEATIDLLFKAENVHLIDFSAEDKDFKLGKPLPVASKASEKLLKLRAIIKDLGVEEGALEETLPSQQVRAQIDSRTIEDLELKLNEAIESRNLVQQRMTDIDMQMKELEPFTRMPIDLDMYRGYENLAVFVGTVRSDPEGMLYPLEEFELIKSSDGRTIALFVAKKDADEAQRLLAQNGYVEISVPDQKGDPAVALKALEEEKTSLSEKVETVNEELEALRKEHMDFILASDEVLSIEVEKAETPLRVGTTGHSFVIDGWIPTVEVTTVDKLLNEELKGAVHMEVVEARGRKEHHEEGHEEDPRFEDVPVKQKNGAIGSKYEFLVSLISRPKYDEIDPSSVIAITFPLFFGLMVGDIGYAIPFIILGWLGLRKCTSKEWRTIATMLFYGGIFAFIFGTFMFGEALGLHFTTPEGSHSTDPTWSSLLGIDLPHEIDLGVFAIPLGMYSKLHDVGILLLISVWIGIAHLFMGYGIGFVNVAIRHGVKHAFMEKFSWVMILAGGVLMGLLAYNYLIKGGELDLTSPLALVGAPLLVGGIVIGFVGEGAGAILELPGLMSNIFSYTRLTAIGMSKAGMALAFNSISIEMIAPSGGVYIIAAFLVFAVGHMTIWMLAIISAGLHSVRLQYVEFFGKFYKGGGLEFNPLRVIRKYTRDTEV